MGIEDFLLSDIFKDEFLELLFPPHPLLAEPRSPHWSKVRNEHLEKHPVCEVCGVKKPLNVHHIKPFHIYPDLELVDSNLITLCETPGRNCHFVLGHLMNWSSWNVDIWEWVKSFKNRP